MHRPVSTQLLAEQIRASLKKHTDPVYLKQLERLVPGVRSVGVKVPKLKTIAAELHKTHKDLTDADAWALLTHFAKGTVRDELLAGIFLIARRRKSLPSVPWADIERWLDAVDNWETCDQLAMNIIAPRVAADAQALARLQTWTTSKNVWQRRAAVACGASLNQRGRSLPHVTLALCAPLLNDPEPMVRKAVVWALREASEKNEAAAFAFLRKHKARVHPTVLREGSEKLTPVHRAALLGQ